MTKKISLNELAEFIASDYTLDIFPDIVWPLECRFPKQRQEWLAGRLEVKYKEFLTGPPETIQEDLQVPDEEQI